MRRLSSVLIVLLISFSLFASVGLSFQTNVGYGYLAGKRYITRTNGTVDNKVSLKATGIEAGILIGYDFSEPYGIEAYFDYLFATKGSFDEDKAPVPTTIPERVKYTDYKAGLGFRYTLDFSESDSVRLATGLNFTGISNHYYYEPECRNQYAGNKVTSFGLYLAASEMHSINDNLALTANVHTCLNFTGFARNFNPGTRKWDNYFPSDGKTTVKLFSTFIQLGMMVRI